MQDIKEKLIITKERIEGEEYIHLNLSLKTLCKLMRTAGFKVYKKLEEEGMDIDCPVLVSQKDVDDYHHYKEMHKDSNPFEELTSEEKFEQDVNHLISNSTYFDIPFTSLDGKNGLKDTLGNIVVPPLFDKAEGTDCLFYERTMARVWKDGKIWLSPRDGSGRIVRK